MLVSNLTSLLSRPLQELNPLPYPVIFCNCICWLVYAMLTNDWFLYFGNLPGMLLGIFFVMSTIRLAPDEVRPCCNPHRTGSLNCKLADRGAHGEGQPCHP